jgi:hypothetical protein
VHDVNVGSADTAKRDLDFDLVLPTEGLLDIPDIDVAVSTGVFH